MDTTPRTIWGTIYRVFEIMNYYYNALFYCNCCFFLFWFHQNLHLPMGVRYEDEYYLSCVVRQKRFYNS